MWLKASKVIKAALSFYWGRDSISETITNHYVLVGIDIVETERFQDVISSGGVAL